MTIETDDQDCRPSSEEISGMDSMPDMPEKMDVKGKSCEEIVKDEGKDTDNVEDSALPVIPHEEEDKTNPEENIEKKEESVEKSPKVSRTNALRNFFSRFGVISPTSNQPNKDVELGTELIIQGESKEPTKTEMEENGANKKKLASSVIEENEKNSDESSKKEKAESDNTDVTVPVTDEKDGEGVPTSKMFSGRFGSKKWRWIISGCFIFFVVFVLAGFLAAQLAYFPPDEVEESSSVAVTNCGPVFGTKTKEGVFKFQGIPYAWPPTESRRWKPPTTGCWFGNSVNRTNFCFQKPISGRELAYNEDCLYLNVFTPTLSVNQLLPVVVHISGSSLHGLSAFDLDLTPKPQLAKDKNVVLVTFNFRFGVFGFMALDLFGKQVEPAASGNYGFHDQIAALTWVKKNIKNFGGDSEKVTLLASGSAATSALALISSEKAKNLFQQVWMTGGSAKITSAPLADIEKKNEEFLSNLGCEEIDCLFQKSSMEILSAVPDWWSQDPLMTLPISNNEPSTDLAIIDGDVLNESYSLESNVNNVTIVIGATAQESAGLNVVANASDWEWHDFSKYVFERLNAMNSNTSAPLIAFYVKDNSSLPEIRLQTMVSDLRVICPLQGLASTLSDLPESKVLFYVVDHRPSVMTDPSLTPMSYHGMDLASILGVPEVLFSVSSPMDRAFSENIQDLFFNFVNTGVAESRKIELKDASQSVNLVGTVIRASSQPYKNCKLWSTTDLTKYARMN